MHVDTPELEQLYRRYQRYQNFAKHYQTVLEGLQGAEVTENLDEHTITFHTAWNRVPKSIPRGKPVQWYVEKYEYYAAKSSDTRDLYWSLHDTAEKRAWEALDRDGKLAQLHEIAKYLDRTKELIQEWRAKIPAWERQRDERGPGQTDAEAYLQEWMDRFSDPRPMIETLEESLRDREADRDWLLDHI